MIQVDSGLISVFLEYFPVREPISGPMVECVPGNFSKGDQAYGSPIILVMKPHHQIVGRKERFPYVKPRNLIPSEWPIAGHAH
jgi:hypothetical protein